MFSVAFFTVQMGFVLLLFLTGCASPKADIDQSAQPQAAETGETTRLWQVGNFRVRFAAGPVQQSSEGGPKGFSSYSVSYQKEGEPILLEIAGSAMNLDLLVHSPSENLSNLISVWTSPSERWLLIREEVPNDWAPCVNFVLIERIEDELKVSYLKMPTWLPPLNPIKAIGRPPVWSEYPEVITITEDEIEYQFSNKLPQRTRIRDVPTMKSVTFPG
jgi:hypothetical protein